MVAPVIYSIDASLRQSDRASEDLPFGAAGHHRPAQLSARRRIHRPGASEADAERIHPRPRPETPADGVRVDGERVKAVHRGRRDERHAAGRGLHAVRSGLGRSGRRTRWTATTRSRSRFTPRPARASWPSSLPGAALGCPTRISSCRPRAGREENRDGNIDDQDGRDQRAVQRQEARAIRPAAGRSSAATRRQRSRAGALRVDDSRHAREARLSPSGDRTRTCRR